MTRYVVASLLALGLWALVSREREVPWVSRSPWQEVREISWASDGRRLTLRPHHDDVGPYLVGHVVGEPPYVVEREQGEGLMSSLANPRSDTGPQTSGMGFGSASTLEIRAAHDTYAWEVGGRGYGHGDFFARESGGIVLLPAALIEPLRRRPGRAMERGWMRREVSRVREVRVSGAPGHVRWVHHDARNPSMAHWRSPGASGQSLVALAWLERAWALRGVGVAADPGEARARLTMEVTYEGGGRDRLELLEQGGRWVARHPRGAFVVRPEALVRGLERLIRAPREEEFVPPPQPREHDPEHGAPPMRRHR